MNITIRKAIQRFLKRSLCPRYFMALGAIVMISSLSAAPMSGTYTVCSSGCDYSKIQDAVQDLNGDGVRGPVIIDIKAGSYNESLDINTIKGVSATNTVTFQGATTGRSYIYATSTYIVDIQYADYVKFKYLTIENTATSGTTYTVYALHNTNIDFTNCDLKNRVLTSFSNCYIVYDYYSSESHYKNNMLTGAYFSMYLYRYSTTQQYGRDTFENNTFKKFYAYGIYNYMNDRAVFTDNVVDSAVYQYSYGLYDNYGVTATYERNKFMNVGYGMALYYPNKHKLNAKKSEIVNNFISPELYGYGIYLYEKNSIASNILIAHNTVRITTTSNQLLGYPLYAYCDKATGIEIFNNIFSAAHAPYYAAYMYFPNKGNDVDGNRWDVPNAAYFANYDNMLYQTFSDYQAAAIENGHATRSSKGLINWASATGYVLDQNATNARGSYAGVYNDFDGDSRCKLFPTAGADESNFGKSKPVSNFFGPTKVLEGSFNSFTNVAKPGEPKIFKWYIDGVLVSDSIELYSNKFVYPSATISLVTTGCGGTDSIAKTFQVDTPSKAPVADFNASRSFIIRGEKVFFGDSSTNGPTEWEWSISPDSIYDDTTQRATYRYTFGSSTTPRNEVQFLLPGNYEVCLVAKNRVGASTPLCRYSYIRVTDTIPPLPSSIPIIYLSGPTKLTIPIFTSFDERDLDPDSVIDYEDGDLTGTKNVVITSNVNMNVVGNYEIIYRATDSHGNSTVAVRNVYVRDLTPPVGVLLGKHKDTVAVGTTYNDPGVSMSDNYDTALTLKVTSTLNTNVLGTYRITYKVIDASGNRGSTLIRTVVVVDTIAPRIIVPGGSDTIVVEVYQKFDLDVVVTDNYYAALSPTVEGEFYKRFPDSIPTKLGVYALVYTVSDSSGNSTTVTKPVLVGDFTAPEIDVIIPGIEVTNLEELPPLEDLVNVTDNYYAVSDLVFTIVGGDWEDRDTTKEGTYFITIRAEDPSGNISKGKVQLIYFVGVDEVASSIVLHLYPNPARSTAFVTLRGDVVVNEWLVVDMHGRTVALPATSAPTADGQAYQLNTQSLSSGMYTIRMLTSEGVATAKLQVIR